MYCFGRTSAIIHANPLLFIPFTECPGSPSLYICRWWARRRWRLDVIRELVLDFCHAGLACNYVGSLENHASRLVILVFRTRRLRSLLIKMCVFMCMLRRQRGCRQSGRLCSLPCSSWILFMSACEALCIKCNMYFGPHFNCIWAVKLCKDVCHFIWLMHCSYGPLVF